MSIALVWSWLQIAVALTRLAADLPTWGWVLLYAALFLIIAHGLVVQAIARIKQGGVRHQPSPGDRLAAQRNIINKEESNVSVGTDERQVRISVEGTTNVYVGARSIAAMQEETQEHLEWALARAQELAAGLEAGDFERVRDLRNTLSLAHDDANALMHLAPLPEEDLDRAA